MNNKLIINFGTNYLDYVMFTLDLEVGILLFLENIYVPDNVEKPRKVRRVSEVRSPCKNEKHTFKNNSD